MTTVIGLAPGERGSAAVHLGAMLARSIGDNVVVVAVVPTPWPPNPYRDVDEFIELQTRSAEESLERAQAHVGTDLAAEFVVHHARSVSSGLSEVAHAHGATLVALGSSEGGILGRVALGGVAQRILHSTDIPVALAPKGFDTGMVYARVARITVAFGRADHDSDLLVTAASVAEDIDATLRVASFAVRPLTEAVGTIEEGADDLVVSSWAKRLDADIAKALGRAMVASPDTVSVATRVDTVIGEGGSWGEALTAVPWADGDVLAVGTSSSPVSRFFLGSHASKIVRHSPVPVFLMPRSMPIV